MDKTGLPQWDGPGGPPVRGVQVVYFPDHVLATGVLLRYTHPGTEFGFITNVRPEKGMAFVRYWSSFNPEELRTTANSEYTPLKNLWPRISKPWPVVDALLEEMKGDK